MVMVDVVAMVAKEKTAKTAKMAKTAKTEKMAKTAKMARLFKRKRGSQCLKGSLFNLTKPLPTNNVIHFQYYEDFNLIECRENYISELKENSEIILLHKIMD